MGLINNNFVFIALAPTGSGISGGDRIFIELARRWSKNHNVAIYTTIEGQQMCERQSLAGKLLTINIVGRSVLPSTFLIKYLYKILLGIRIGISLSLDTQKDNIFIYSSSDFWMDVLPAVLLKIRYPRLRWIAAWFQTAPNPLTGFKEGMRENAYKVSALMYWLSQLPVKPIIKAMSQSVIVNNNDERKQFDKLDRQHKVIVLLGAVDLEAIANWIETNSNLPKIYDAVFQGRFHPQKGVVELVDIWKRVVGLHPKAKLAMIGDGPLRIAVEDKIKQLGLKNNIQVLGFVFDGDKKYRVFSQSKMVVHPAFFDSGGMASAEAMAFGLPCIGFDLISYKSYYPVGMHKVPIGDLDAFSKAISGYISNPTKRNHDGRVAQDFVRAKWSWNDRASEVLNKLLALD